MIWVFIIIILVIAFCYYSNNYIDVTPYIINLGIKDSVHIVHLSDLHSKQFGKGNKRLINRISQMAPDIIVITGDLIDDSAKMLDETLDFAGSLTKIGRVFYIFGNHEHRTVYLEKIRNRLKGCGVHVLQNGIEEINVKGNQLVFLGLDEKQGSKKNYKERRKGTFVYEDNSIYFLELEKHEGVKIVLSHFPENFDNPQGYQYNKYNFDIQLSGHAHGGQFNFPFVGGVFAPGQGIRPKFYSGLYGSHPYMLVSRGLGNSGFPLRLFNRPNIVELYIK